MRSLFESARRPLLKSGLQLFARYGSCQEAISRRPEQMQLHLTQDWNGLGAIVQVRLKQALGGQSAATIGVISRPLLKSGLRPLARYGPHQETISGRPE